MSHVPMATTPRLEKKKAIAPSPERSALAARMQTWFTLRPGASVSPSPSPQGRDGLRGRCPQRCQSPRFVPPLHPASFYLRSRMQERLEEAEISRFDPTETERRV